MPYDSWLNSGLRQLLSDAKVVEYDRDMLEFAKCALPNHLVKKVFHNIIAIILWLMSLTQYFIQQCWEGYKH